MDGIRPSISFVSTCFLLAACGPATPPPAPAPPPAPTVSAAPSAEPVVKPAELPASCETRTDKWCLPPKAFVERLCAGSFPNVALAMFAKGTPWTRVYLRVKSVEAWNAGGGRQSSGKIVFEEEMVVLAHRDAAPGGMTVSGAGNSLDVLRWDGTCASLMEEEISTRAPFVPKAAKVPWKNLDDAIQNAMLSDEKISKVVTDRDRECKGVTADGENPKCDKASSKLTDLVADYVRRGGTVPPPARIP